jgi:hypothetical protein
MNTEPNIYEYENSNQRFLSDIINYQNINSTESLETQQFENLEFTDNSLSKNLESTYIETQQSDSKNNKLSNDLEISTKLSKLGFNNSSFEVISKNRFIVITDFIPPEYIMGIKFPSLSSYLYNPGNPNEKMKKDWCGPLTLKIFHVPMIKMEETLINLDENSKKIEIKILNNSGDIDFTWEIDAKFSSVQFDELDWNKVNAPSIIEVEFDVDSVNIKY